jgi:pimeloyl-ACP methyl ester carboxylesterase
VIVLWPSILADHRIYRAPIEAWRGRHRLVVIDGPGHGDSGPAPGPFTMAQCGQALGEVLDALGITQPVVVIGTSWGGLVAGEFALAQPKRTLAVVMLNTPVIMNWSPNCGHHDWHEALSMVGRFGRLRRTGTGRRWETRYSPQVL